MFRRTQLPLRIWTLTFLAALTPWFTPGLLAADGKSNDFPVLLDKVERARTPMERGFDQFPQSFDQVGNRLIRLLGSPQTWDPYGTPALRSTVIARWKKRWKEHGAGMLNDSRSEWAGPGRVAASTGGSLFVRDLPSMHQQFFLNNRRLYELGAMDGSFPPSGFMLGDQSGIWLPPVKALDGFRFVIREKGERPWSLTDCQQFEHDFASAIFHYSARNWRFTRVDFPAAEHPALFSLLTLTNEADLQRDVEIDLIADVNIRPDWRTTAQLKHLNDLDSIEIQDGVVKAWDQNLPQSMVLVGCDRTAIASKIEDASASLTYRLTLPAHGAAMLTCLIVGRLDPANHENLNEFKELVRKGKEVLGTARKLQSDRTASGVAFTCSDVRLNETFVFAKANLELLTSDHRPFFPDLYLSAGVPIYPRLFACDALISVPGATASGNWLAARGTLKSLAAQAQRYGFLVPHESATDGSLIGNSNAQETTQFIATCWRHVKWTGDRKFIEDLFPVLKEALAAHEKRFLKDRSGYPIGSALIEAPGMGSKTLDAACWQCVAYRALAEISQVLGKPEEGAEFLVRSNAMLASIQSDWWMTDKSIWADSLDAKGQQKSDGLWSIVFPGQLEVADSLQTGRVLDAIEHGWVNQWGGVHTRQADIRREDSSTVATGVFTNAAFGGGRSDLGLRLLHANAEAARQARMPGGFTEMVPPGELDFVQLWSAAPFLEAIIEGMAGLAPNALQHELALRPQLPRGLDWYTVKNVRVGQHELWVDVHREQSKIISTITHVKGPKNLKIQYRPGPGAVSLFVDGKLTGLVPSSSMRNKGNFEAVPLSLAPGQKVIISE